jgi:hypothetical protein
VQGQLEADSSVEPSLIDAKEEGGAVVKVEPQADMQQQAGEANGAADTQAAAAPAAQGDGADAGAAGEGPGAAPADHQAAAIQQHELKNEGGVEVKTEMAEDVKEVGKASSSAQPNHTAPDMDVEDNKPQAAADKADDSQQVLSITKEEHEAAAAQTEAPPPSTPPPPPSTTPPPDLVAAAEAAAAAAAARAHAAETAAAEAVAASQGVEEEVYAHMFRVEFSDLPAVTGLFSRTLYLTGLGGQVRRNGRGRWGV